MELLKKVEAAQQAVFDYFGYVEDWVVIPLDDGTGYFWYLEDPNGEGGSVCFADTEEELESQDGNYYTNEIHTQRHLPKWVYRGEEYTMVCVDTHTDGNKFLQIFDNAKERPDSSNTE